MALTLVADFAARGHEIDLLVMQKRGELLSQLPSAVRLVDLGAPRIRDVIRPLAKYLRERRREAVQVSMWPLTVAAIVARTLARSTARLVVSDHALLSKHYAGNPRALRCLRATIRLFYPWADARVIAAAAAADDLARLSWLMRESLEVIYSLVLAPEAPLHPPADVEAQWG